MIPRNNSSFDTSTAQSSRTASPLPGGFYCYEDGLTSPSPGRYSPVTLSSSSPSRLVASCKNCGFSFRVRSPRTTDFCSKDCETCFTILSKNKGTSSPCPAGPQKTAQEIRKSIYEFQTQIARLEEEEEARKRKNKQQSPQQPNTTPSPLPKPHTPADLPRPPSILLPVALPLNLPPTPPSPSLGGEEVSPGKTSTAPVMWALNPASLFFKSPKPARPQLHAYI